MRVNMWAKPRFARYALSIGDVIGIARVLWDTSKTVRRKWRNASIFTKYRVAEATIGTFVPGAVMSSILLGGVSLLGARGINWTDHVLALGSAAFIPWWYLTLWSKGHLHEIRRRWIWSIPVVHYKCLHCGWDKGLFTEGEPSRCKQCKARWKIQGLEYQTRPQHSETWN